jgi:hypothetical protein
MKNGTFKAVVPKSGILEWSWVVVLLLTVGMVFLVVSCKSTAASAPATLAPETSPTAETTPPPPPPPAPALPTQASLNALDEAIARAQDARKRAEDFEGDSRFPGDWSAAEADLAAAGDRRGTPAEVSETEAKYRALADKYDEIFGKTLPLYAQDRETEVLAARDAAIAAGIREVYPEYLLDADTTALDALDRYEAEDYYAADEGSRLALGQYQALKPGAEAYTLRQEIVDRDFFGYDQDNFSRADTTLTAAFNHYGEKDPETARNEADEALLRYNLVMKAGWAGSVGKLQTLAQAERQKALNEKANVAVRNDFAETEKVYNQAAVALRAEQFQEAGPLYEKSASSYTILARSAAEKRRIAEDAISKAEEKMAESETMVQNAELILEGGAQ